MKTTNIEIYNFLNLTSHRFGKIYKYTGSSPLPAGFEITEQKIKEKLFLYQLHDENIFPSFIVEDKNQIKKYFKNSIKNCKKIRRNNYFCSNFSKDFAEKVEVYFEMRILLTSTILKEFKNHAFDEAAAYREVYNIDPIFGQIFDQLFFEKINFEAMFDGLEKKYKTTYLQKVQLLEKANAQKEKKKQQHENQAALAKQNAKNKEKAKETGKKADKIAKNKQKTVQKQEALKTKQEIKKTKMQQKEREK